MVIILLRNNNQVRTFTQTNFIILSSRFEDKCLRITKPGWREIEKYWLIDKIRLRKYRGANLHLERNFEENWCSFLEAEGFVISEEEESSWGLWEKYDKISWQDKKES